MVNGVISVIPAIAIVYIVDTVVDAAEMSGGIGLVNKWMLGPVAHHHDKPGVKHGYNKNHQRRLKIDKAHDEAEGTKGKLSDAEAHVYFFALALEEVHECFRNADE